jgi:hypothetical protein
VIVGRGVTALVAFYLWTDDGTRSETGRQAEAFSLESHVVDHNLQQNYDD